MKIYNIKTISFLGIENHGYFDFVECQSKLVELAFKDDIDKIEIYFETVKTHHKEYKNV